MTTLVIREVGGPCKVCCKVDLRITQINNLRGGCNSTFINNMRNVTSRRGGLLSINNKDNRCLLYFIAAAYTCKKKCLLYKDQIRLFIPSL